MITEDYVSFETAKLLKGKGFAEISNTIGTYNSDGVFYLYKHEKGYNHNHLSSWYSAPTHQMTMAWLREKGLYIYVQPTRYIGGALYGFQAVIEDEKNNWEKHIFHSESYNEAVEVGIKHCLENLI